MAIAKTIIFNFHVKYGNLSDDDIKRRNPIDPVFDITDEKGIERRVGPNPNDPIYRALKSLELTEQTRETADLKRKEAARKAAQNPDAKPRNKADTGVLVVDAQRRVRLEEAIRDTVASGYKPIDAYWEHKRRFVDGMPTDILEGCVYRVVFKLDATEDEIFLEKDDVEELVKDFTLMSKMFTAPCLNVWDNARTDPNGTHTVNVAHALQRKGKPSEHVGDCSLRFSQGEYRLEPWWNRKTVNYLAPPRIRLDNPL